MSTHIFDYIGDSDRFGYGKYLCLEPIIDDRTKYINATKLCKRHDKNLDDWLTDDNTKELIEHWSNLNKHQTPYYEIDTSDLKGLSKIKQYKVRGIYLHVDLFVMVAQWASTTFASEVSGIMRNR